MKSLYKKITLALMALFLPLAIALPATVYAQSEREVCRGVGAATGTDSCEVRPGSVTVDSVIQTVINILSAVVGVASVIMIIIGGFKYVTSGGDASSISSAKQTITYALVGVVVAALAQAFVVFVLNEVD